MLGSRGELWRNGGYISVTTVHPVVRTEALCRLVQTRVFTGSEFNCEKNSIIYKDSLRFVHIHSRYYDVESVRACIAKLNKEVFSDFFFFICVVNYRYPVMYHVFKKHFEWNNNALTMKFISESNFPDDDDDTTFFYVKSYFRLLQSFLTESLKNQFINIFRRLFGNCKLKQSWHDD